MSPSPSIPAQAQQEQRGLKRKKPPTFQHLPAQRAKKLKREWIEVQKIKSKWRAQKRKEGLGTSRAGLKRMTDAAEDEAHRPEEEDVHDAYVGKDKKNSISSSSGGDEGSEESEAGSEDEASDPEDLSVEELPHKALVSGKSRQEKPRAHRDENQSKTDERPSARDLQRRAYSRTSLHTHKSDPFHRRKGAPTSKDRGEGRGTGRGRGRGDGRGRRGGRQRGRGRGQPDMGLRMKAMLEKIKQDFT